MPDTAHPAANLSAWKPKPLLTPNPKPPKPETPNPQPPGPNLLTTLDHAGGAPDQRSNLRETSRGPCPPAGLGLFGLSQAFEGILADLSGFRSFLTVIFFKCLKREEVSEAEVRSYKRNSCILRARVDFTGTLSQGVHEEYCLLQNPPPSLQKTQTEMYIEVEKERARESERERERE